MRNLILLTKEDFNSRSTTSSTKGDHIMKNALTLLSIIGMLTVSAQAASVTVQFDSGTTRTISGLSSSSGTGHTMAGMDVTATFTDTTSEKITWASLGGTSGQAAGTGWSLSESGDTFSSPWTLANSSGLGIVELLLEGLSGITTFDTYFNDAYGTDGSARGTDFSVVSGLGQNDIVATYRDLVAVSGSAPVGDIYADLDIDFVNSGGFASGSTLTFTADTDVVPEPATLGLLAVGGLALIRRRRRWIGSTRTCSSLLVGAAELST